MADPNDLPRARSESFRDVYANFVSGQLGAYDLTLTFIQMKEVVPGQGPIQEEQVRVTLSPVQFKLLAALCGRLTEAYERAVAPIALPAHDTTPKRSADDLVKQITAALNEENSATSSSTAAPPPVKRPRAAPKRRASKP